MLRKNLFNLVILVAILLLTGCSDNRSNAILDHVSDKKVATTSDKTKSYETLEWSGEWTRNLLHNKGLLNITNVTNKAFDFELNAASGGNTGTIEGKAQVSNDTALFVMDDSSCEINFKWSKDTINVAVTEECQSWGGNGTFFHGGFEKRPNDEEPDLETQGILTEKENKLFRSVVGQDYPLFLENMMIFYEEDDKDGLETEVLTGEVRGMASSMRAIIMVNDKFVYAAVPSNKNSSLFYYTNDENYSKKVPTTIIEWIEGGQEFRNIIYK